MRMFITKIFILFSAFFVGIATNYIYHSLFASVEQTQITPKNANVDTAQTQNKIKEKPKEPDFFDVSPCNGVNPTKQYSASAKIILSAGVVNSKVLCGKQPDSLPMPEKFAGILTVSVLIDQYGDVKDAHIMNGYRRLNKSVLNAVRQTRFAPFMLRGEPVKVSGVLVYKFDSDGKLKLQQIRKPLLVPN